MGVFGVSAPSIVKFFEMVQELKAQVYHARTASFA